MMIPRNIQALASGGKGKKRARGSGQEDTPPSSKRARTQGQSHEEQFKKNGLRSYTRGHPSFWEESLAHPSKKLFPTLIVPNGHGLSSMILLTRTPLPDLPSFDLFFSGAANTVSLQTGLPFHVKKRQIRDLRRYTLRLHRIIGNKPFICDEQSIPYFLAPLSAQWEGSSVGLAINLPDVASHIDWDAVSLAASQAYVRLTPGSPEIIAEQLRDAVLQDRWVEYTKRYFVVKIRQDLSPMHKPGEGEREAGHSTYLDYCKARVKDFKGLENPETPLVEIENVPGIVNLLDPSLEPQLPAAKGSPKYLIPELCGKCTIPSSVLKTMLAFPSILLRINELLLIRQLNATAFSAAISDLLLRTALTPPAAGADVNYERLEILGDAILKYTSSAYVFIHYPTEMEGSLHGHRREIISNKSLWKATINTDVPQYILSKSFLVKQWYPANISVRASFNPVVDDEMEDTDIVSTSGAPTFKRHKEQCAQQLGDKTIADTAEAIIAAAYLSGGHRALEIAMNYLKIPILEDTSTSKAFRDALHSPPISTGSRLPLKQVEKIIGHGVKHPFYLSQVLVRQFFPGMTGSNLRYLTRKSRTSLPNYKSTSFERLEFLGDGILDFLTMNYIYEREPDLPPSALTLLKCAMVSNPPLATLCVTSGMYEFVEAGPHHLGDSLKRFVEEVLARRDKEFELAAKENRSPGQYWLDIECPKTVSDIMEATLGALFVSDGCSLLGATAFFDNVFRPFYDTHIAYKSLVLHATNTVVELFQKKGCNQFRIDKKPHGNKTQCKVLVHGVLLGQATDAVASTATRRACEAALGKLTGELKNLTQPCDCQTQGKKELKQR